VFLKGTILEAIHSIMPDLALTDIILRIGPVPVRPPGSAPTPLASSATPVLPSLFAIALTERLNNPELQAILSQTITKALSLSSPITPEKT
jgi:hypothetical protein